MHQNYQDTLRGAILTGPDENPVIELPDGERMPVGRDAGCLPPLVRGDIIKIDCTLLDGPAYYFDESTRGLLEACSFWFPDTRRCPPKQWPIDIPGCDGRAASGIKGTWRLYAFPVAGGYSLISSSQAITLTDDTIRMEFGASAQFERSYTVLEQADRQYALEIRDADSATTTIAIELVPCGLVIESAGVCDEFCQNIARRFGEPTDEQVREIARLVTGAEDEASIDRMAATIRESIEQGPQPIFDARAVYAAESAQ